MVRNYRLCFIGFFIFAMLSAYSTEFGGALSVLFSIIAFVFFAIFLYYFIRVKFFSFLLFIEELRNKMR